MLKKEIRSFGNALRGLGFLAREEMHFRFHLYATVVTLALGFLFEISTTEWLVVLFCIGIVMTAEAFNTALEVVLNKLHPEQDPLIGKAKDIAAAAVLITGVISAVIGMTVFLPYVIGN